MTDITYTHELNFKIFPQAILLNCYVKWTSRKIAHILFSQDIQSRWRYCAWAEKGRFHSVNGEGKQNRWNKWQFRRKNYQLTLLVILCSRLCTPLLLHTFIGKMPKFVRCRRIIIFLRMQECSACIANTKSEFVIGNRLWLERYVRSELFLGKKSIQNINT